MQTMSSIKDWRTCRRKFRYRHVDLVRPVVKGKALYVGSATHDGLEAFDKGEAYELPEDFDPIEAARVRAMLTAYASRWGDGVGTWETVALEKEFEVELGARELGGKWDALKRNTRTGALYLWERKTTSEEIGTVGDDYWQRLAIDLQLAIYQYAAELVYGEPVKILYDVIRKPLPQSAPKMKKRIARRKDESDESLEARKAEVMETIEEFEARMVETMLADPDAYLVRREISRTAEQQDMAEVETAETLIEIGNYAGFYPRNDAACTARWGTCPYLGVCAGYESLDSDRFERLETSHPELSNTNQRERETHDSYASECPL